MANPQPSDGRRDLALIRASGSTARVLNLALVFERFGETEELNANPLFRSKWLNRALILKHAVRPHERDLFERPEPHTLKIVFPYSSTELGLGGTSLMMGEKRFDSLLRRAIGESVSADDYEADFDLLCLLHDIPSFDPFLLREQLRRAGREPARCFFDISDADIGAMLDFVADQIEPLTNLAFGANGRKAERLSMRLSEKLMTDEGARLLDPLRETLRLSPAEYRSGVFAWKGFLYYKWLLGDLMARQHAFDASFAKCSVICSDAEKRAEIDGLKRSVLRGVELVMRRTSEAMLDYNNAFAALLSGQPGTFRSFLLDAPATFIRLGDAVGALKHIHSFWSFRFPAKSVLKLEAEEALEVMQEFDRMLSGVSLITHDPSEELKLRLVVD